MCLWLSWSLTLKSSMSYWREHRRVGQIGRILLRPTVTPWSFTNLYPNTPLSHCITTVRNVSTEKENKKTFTASRNIDLRLVHPNQQFTSIHLVSFKNSFSLSISLSLPPSPFKNCTHVLTAFDKSIMVGDVGWPNHLFDLPGRMSTSVFSSKSWVRPR